MEVGPAIRRGTPPKFNCEFTPEKWWLEDDPPFKFWVLVTFQGRAVKLREGILCQKNFKKVSLMKSTG